MIKESLIEKIESLKVRVQARRSYLGDHSDVVDVDLVEIIEVLDILVQTSNID